MGRRRNDLDTPPPAIGCRTLLVYRYLSIFKNFLGVELPDRSGFIEKVSHTTGLESQSP